MNNPRIKPIIGRRYRDPKTRVLDLNLCGKGIGVKKDKSVKKFFNTLTKSYLLTEYIE